MHVAALSWIGDATLAIVLSVIKILIQYKELIFERNDTRQPMNNFFLLLELAQYRGIHIIF